MRFRVFSGTAPLTAGSPQTVFEKLIFPETHGVLVCLPGFDGGRSVLFPQHRGESPPAACFPEFSLAPGRVT